METLSNNLDFLYIKGYVDTLRVNLGVGGGSLFEHCHDILSALVYCIRMHLMY